MFLPAFEKVGGLFERQRQVALMLSTCDVAFNFWYIKQWSRRNGQTTVPLGSWYAGRIRHLSGKLLRVQRLQFQWDKCHLDGTIQTWVQNLFTRPECSCCSTRSVPSIQFPCVWWDKRGSKQSQKGCYPSRTSRRSQKQSCG